MRRRDAIRLLALPALAAAGCGAGRGTIRVAVVWSGSEFTQFRRVLRAFPSRDRWDVSVLSAGDDIAALLGNRVAGSAAPNVALVPRPQLVREHLRQLMPLRAASPDDTAWDRLLTVDGQVYGTWFKVAHKSMVWYRRDGLGVDPSHWEWNDWVAYCHDRAGQGRPPLAIGAADGWVLTDWFENVLLSLAPAVYRGLASGARQWRNEHPAVMAALTRLGELWQIPGVFAGGAERALLTQFDQSLLDVFEHRGGAMVAGSDFAWPFITQYTNVRPEEIGWFHFPHVARPAVLVGGDAAVLVRPDDKDGRGRHLIDWLRTAQAADIWARTGGFLSINQQTSGYPPALLAEPLLNEVRVGSGDGGEVTFDLSDQLGGRLSGGEGRGSFKIFKDFFADVAVRRIDVGRAVQRALTAFDAAEAGI
ncbi:MAG TPA: hypothetical protein VH912_11970 [Streptosporangiaceae bacterium]